MVRRFCPPFRPTLVWLSAVACLLSILTVTQCNFLTVQNNKQTLHLGLFSVAIRDANGSILGCVKYTDTSNIIDGMFQTGRAFGISTVVCSTLAFITLLWCHCFRPHYFYLLWALARFTLAFATVGQMFIFLVIGSESCQHNDCVIASVGYLGLVNVALMGGLSIAIFAQPPPSAAWLTWWVLDDGEAKETLATIDKHTAEFLSSDAVTHSEHQLSDVLSEGLPSDQGCRNHSVDNEEIGAARCAQSVMSSGILSHATQQSIQESMASTVGIQSLRPFRLVVALLVAFAWAVSVVGVQRCTFLLVGPTGGQLSTYSGLGLFSRALYHNGQLIGCVAYAEEVRDKFDEPFQTSRIFGAMTTFLMTAVMLFVVAQLFSHVAKEELWLTVRALLPCATITQGLAFLAFRTKACTSNNLVECRPGGTGIIVILNLLFLLGLTILAIVVPPPPGPLFRIRRREEMPLNDEPVHDFVSGPVMNRKAHSIADDTLGETNIDEEATQITERIIKISPLGPDLPRKKKDDGVVSIKVQVSFDGNEKKTIKTLTHPDGTQTITTTIEELAGEIEMENTDTLEDVDLGGARQQVSERLIV